MGNKKRGVTDMNTASITETSAGEAAKQFAKDLLQKEHRGPGDTIEAAAYRLQRRLKVDAGVILQGWNRPARDMKVSRWLPLFRAWCREFPERIYEPERSRHDDNSWPARLADLVAGEKDRPVNPEE